MNRLKLCILAMIFCGTDAIGMQSFLFYVTGAYKKKQKLLPQNTNDRITNERTSQVLELGKYDEHTSSSDSSLYSHHKSSDAVIDIEDITPVWKPKYPPVNPPMVLGYPNLADLINDQMLVFNDEATGVAGIAVVKKEDLPVSRVRRQTAWKKRESGCCIIQ